LPQDDRSVIYHSDLFFIENPLAFNLAGFDDQDEEPIRFEMKDGLTIGAGRKLVPFIHYQSSFARYAQLFLVLKRWRVPAGLITAILRYRIEEDRFVTSFIYKVLSKAWFGAHRDWGRSRVMKGLLMNVKGSTVADLLNFMKQYPRS
jgi:hypothetical protein